jgi:NmrA-like family
MSNDTGLPLITVVGASGKQGRSVVDSLARRRHYRVRALTRRLDTALAQQWRDAGVEVRAVGLQPGMQRELTAALRGSYGAFLMTPNIIPPADYEFALGREQADAALAAGVQHVVFSSLENVEKRTAGRKWVPHFTAKALVEEYIRDLPITSSFIYLAFFYTNVMEFFPPVSNGDGLTFSLYLPHHARQPFVDPMTATGPPVVEIFAHPQQYAGASLPVIGEILSGDDMAAAFERVTGICTVYEPAYTRESLVRTFPAIGANQHLVRELIGMAEYAVEYGYYAEDRDLAWSRRVDSQALTWEQFLIRYNWRGTHTTFGSGEAQGEFDQDLKGRAPAVASTTSSVVPRHDNRKERLKHPPKTKEE